MATVSLLGSTINTTAGAKTVTATPAVGDLIVIALQASKATNSSVTFNAPTDNNSSGTYSRIGTGDIKVTNNANFYVQCDIYVRNALISSATSTIFTMPAPTGPDDGGGLAVLKITGMSKAGSSAIRQFKSATSGTSSANPSTGTWTRARLTTNPTIGVVVTSTNPAAVIPTSQFTELIDTGYTTPTTGFEIQSRDSGDTGSTMVWYGVQSYWGCIGFELDASSPGTNFFLKFGF